MVSTAKREAEEAELGFMFFLLEEVETGPQDSWSSRDCHPGTQSTMLHDLLV
jgi:hypothetical protein